ncbi:MAG TPA: TIGR03790 family protein, partial [Burkholderiaceae bacterium]|nr:TIGR03790 family protein [Burkholderiaceae bacterium]
GATAIEAYWRSVAWPAQGLFIGEPLAAPYRQH